MTAREQPRGAGGARGPRGHRGEVVLGAVMAAVAAGAALDLWVAVRPGLAPIAPAAMAAARATLEAERQPGTLVVHSPLFSVAELAPLGSLSARPDVPDARDRSVRRLLVLDRPEAPIRGLGAPSTRVELEGGLVLSVHEPAGGAPGRRVLFDLLDGLGRDTLHVERPLGLVATRCDAPRSEGGFACPGQPEWLYAAPRRFPVGGQDADCTWAHPTPSGGALVYTLPAPPEPAPGHRLVLELGAGIADEAVRTTANGAAVTTRVVQGGRTIGQVVRTNALGFARTRVPLTPGVSVRLEVTAEQDGARHHCLEAIVVELPTAEATR